MLHGLHLRKRLTWILPNRCIRPCVKLLVFWLAFKLIGKEQIAFVFFIFVFHLFFRAEQLLSKPVPGSDLDPRVIGAYITTCQAEAQEVTIARAIELKHSASLISALSNQTSQLFLTAAASLTPLEPKHFAKWLIYLQLKAEVYESYVC